MILIFLRSTAFNFFMAIWTIFITTMFIPTLLTFNVKIISYIGIIWSDVMLWALRVFCNINHIVLGKENVPHEPCIIASKHQSMWETIFLMHYFNRPVFILKKELTHIPFYGWYLVWMGMICINRTGGASALKQIIRQAKDAFAKKRSIIIFPEGTRLEYGKRGKIQPGVIAMHNAFPEIPIVPVSVDSGKLWKKNSWLRLPGTVTARFAAPIIGQKLEKDQLLERLNDGINLQ